MYCTSSVTYASVFSDVRFRIYWIWIRIFKVWIRIQVQLKKSWIQIRIWTKIGTSLISMCQLILWTKHYTVPKIVSCYFYSPRPWMWYWPIRMLLQSVAAGNHMEARIRGGIYSEKDNQASIKRYAKQGVPDCEYLAMVWRALWVWISLWLGCTILYCDAILAKKKNLQALLHTRILLLLKECSAMWCLIPRFK